MGKAATYANQIVITMGAKPIMDESHPYTRMNIDAMQQAMMCLKEAGLKMWLYLSKNQSGFDLKLSRAECEKWGIKKGSYYNGITDLKENGYLVQVDGNQQQFNEVPILVVDRDVKGFEETPIEVVEEKKEAVWDF